MNKKMINTNHFGSNYLRNQNINKIKNMMSTTSKYTKLRPYGYNYNGDENMTIDYENLKSTKNLYAKALNAHN